MDLISLIGIGCGLTYSIGYIIYKKFIGKHTIKYTCNISNELNKIKKYQYHVSQINKPQK